jgi:large subunit ribosomal protein L23
VKSTTRDARSVILAPVVSEKSYALIEDNRYSFKVHPDAHKTQIRQAIEELFSVRVIDVKTIKVRPKPKRRGIHRGTRPGYKKAIVRVAEGQTIPVFEGVG